MSFKVIHGHLSFYLYYSTIFSERREQLSIGRKRSGTEIGNSEFDFFPLPHQEEGVKADEISVVEPTQPLRLARQSKK